MSNIRIGIYINKHRELKIRNQIDCKITDGNKWGIVFYDENGPISYCAIPPTNDDRTDIILQTTHQNGGSTCYKLEYFYDYQKNLKKLREERIIIKIKSGLVELEYKK